MKTLKKKRLLYRPSIRGGFLEKGDLVEVIHDDDDKPIIIDDGSSIPSILAFVISPTVGPKVIKLGASEVDLK